MDPDIARLRKTVGSFVALTSTDVVRPAGDGWGTREVLAHLVHWHEHYVRIVHARLLGLEPPLPRGSFNALNALAVDELSGVPTSTFVRRFLRAQRDLERFSEAAAAARVHVRIKEGAMAWPWRTFVRRIEAHIRNHERALRRAAR